MASARRSVWQELASPVRSALSNAWQSGASPDATALYARWWQLETWLRSVVYVERSARDGRRWAEGLPVDAEKRERNDRRNAYMASPDAQDRLAYLDAHPLLTSVLIDDWDLYSDTLIDRDVWVGRVGELLKVRHRIGHCRRPHVDDLSRLEQTLRDLEPGALRAVSAYNRRIQLDHDLDDPVVDAWVRGNHDDAVRLTDHARHGYQVNFELSASRRPWAEPWTDGEPVSGRAGYLWHATFTHTGGWPVHLRDFWDDGYMKRPCETLVYLTATDPFTIDVSFAAVDDANTVADRIGDVFDAVLANSDRGWTPAPNKRERWARDHQDLDPRLQLRTAWATARETATPFPVFGV